MATVGDLAATDLVYRTGVSDGLSGPLAGANKLWLPIWSGEVIHAYDEYNMFEGLVDSKTITSGVAMEFPITGTVQLKAAWDAGIELVGGDASSTTIAIKLDKRPMAAHFEIDNIDLMQTQWEFRSELARQAGLTLANARDKQIAAYIARAGCEDIAFDSTFTGDGSPANAMLTGANVLDPRAIPTGPVYLNTAFFSLGVAGAGSTDRTNAALGVLQAIEDFFVYLQTINAPTDGVVCAVEPRAFQDIRALGVARAAADTKNLQPMFAGVAAAGGLGAPFTMGMNGLQDSLEYMGCTIIKSNHLPVVNYASGSIGEARYCEEFGDAGVCGLLFQRGAVASLKLQGLKVDTVDDIRRNTVFTVASMMGGTGVLRPELAAVLVRPTDNNTDSNQALEKAIADGFKLYRNTNANFAAATQASIAAVNGYVDNAGSGGEEASKARFVLRRIMTMTREYLPTASGAFPYA